MGWGKAWFSGWAWARKLGKASLAHSCHPSSNSVHQAILLECMSVGTGVNFLAMLYLRRSKLQGPILGRYQDSVMQMGFKRNRTERARARGGDLSTQAKAGKRNGM